MVTTNFSSNAHQMSTLQTEEFPKGNKKENNEVEPSTEFHSKELFKDSKNEELIPELQEKVEQLSGGEFIINRDFFDGATYYVEPDKKSIKNFIANKIYECKEQFHKEYVDKMEAAKAHAFNSVFFCNFSNFNPSDSVIEKRGGKEYSKLLSQSLRESIVWYDDLEFNYMKILSADNWRDLLSEREKAEFGNLPDAFLAYQGIKSEGKLSKSEFLASFDDDSWTLDINNAMFNCEQVASIIVPKSAVSFYYNWNGEKAISYTPSSAEKSTLKILDSPK